MKGPRGFTLIELLVVISIIALLSSVVLASLNSARDKGRLGAGKQFAANIDHAEGDYAIGMWDFSECSGASVNDRTGYNSPGNFIASPSWSTDTPNGQGCSVSLNGSTQYVDLGNASALNTPTTALTVATWVKFNSLSAGSIVSKWGAVASSNYSWLLFANFFGGSGSGQVNFLVSGNGTSYSNAASANGVVTTGKWYYIAGVYDGTTAKLYVDGALVGTVSGVPSPLKVSATNVAIGVDYDNGGSAYRFLNGLVDNTHIFAKALTAAEIGKLYAAGLPAHRFAVQ